MDNGAASLTLGAARSGVNPCPYESILSGLKELSIRSDRPQLSKYGVNPVPVTSMRCDTKYPRKRCWHTFVENTQAFLSQKVFDYASLSPAGFDNARHSIHNKEAQLSQLIVQAALQAQRVVVGWLWAQCGEV